MYDEATDEVAAAVAFIIAHVDTVAPVVFQLLN